METDISYSEPSSRACERETAASVEQWSNWTTNQIRSAIEDERERTCALLSELLAGIQRDTIPETVATLPALRGPVGPPGKLPIAKEWTRETVYYEGSVVTYDGGSYQALRDTGESPDNETHWRCLAAPGRDAKSIRHRGTFTEGSDYAAYAARVGTAANSPPAPGQLRAALWSRTIDLRVMAGTSGFRRSI
jgi:hypothetical protein